MLEFGIAPPAPDMAVASTGAPAGEAPGFDVGEVASPALVVPEPDTERADASGEISVAVTAVVTDGTSGAGWSDV